MTEQEAIGYLKTLPNRIPLKFYTDNGIKVYDEFSQVATSALEKHIPKKPEMEKYTKRKLYFCPICGTEVTDCTYCSHCGQAIDWSEQLSLYEIEHGRNFKGNKNAR